MTVNHSPGLLEQHFSKFRQHVIGIDQHFDSPYGSKPIVYADWTASGRLYGPIEDVLKNEIGPFVGNTHTNTTVTGSSMTNAYHTARTIIKKHVGASDTDILIASNTGMTGVVNKFQRILGLKLHERFLPFFNDKIIDRPVVFCSHMEHHSNQTSWLETIADVRIINPDSEGLMDLAHLRALLEEFKDRKVKIAAITSCSNVTGIITPYHEVAKLMHENDGLCFVDFACSAPYIGINMHPDNEKENLDAIYFSPHKFLGGPGSSGILIFDQKLYKNRVPDNPGGGTVDWTNPWGGHKYLEQIEAREDGGTPGFLQTIRVALCIKLKEKMGVENMLQREKEMMQILWEGLKSIEGLHLLADNIPHRLGVISFYIDDLHYNLGVKLLNDRFGIQVRGGCSCAGTYGHYLLHVSKEKSKKITDQINAGNLLEKPGWIRLSIHPIMTNEELYYILDSIRQMGKQHRDWQKDYDYQLSVNEFIHKTYPPIEKKMAKEWFEIDFT